MVHFPKFEFRVADLPSVPKMTSAQRVRLKAKRKAQRQARKAQRR